MVREKLHHLGWEANMNKAKKAISALLSLDLLQYLFFFVVTVRLFMSLQPTSTNLVYAFSIYASVVLVYQFWKNPTRLKGVKNLLLILFMLSYAVTVLLNAKYNFNSNLFLWLFAFAAAFLYFPIDRATTPDKVKKKMFGYAVIYTGIVFIYNLISIGMLLCSYGVNYYLYNHQGVRMRYRIGFINKRLWGVYTSPNVGAMACWIAVVLSILILFFAFKKRYKFRKLIAVWSGLSIAAAMIYIGFSDSRGQMLNARLLLLVLPIIFFRNIQSFFQKRFHRYRLWMNIAVCVLLSVVMTSLVNPVIYGIRYAVAPAVYYLNTEKYEQEAGEGKSFVEIIGIGRGVDEELGADNTNGRITIWIDALKAWTRKPIFGLSKENVYREVIKFNPNAHTGLVSHCHNAYIDVLVDTGLVGFSLFAALALLCGLPILKYIFAKKQSDDDIMIKLLITVFAMLLISGFYETFVLFNLQAFTPVLFSVMGCLDYLLFQYQRPRKQDRVLIFLLGNYKLMTALTVKKQFYADRPVDVVLTSECHIDERELKRLQDCNAFDQVIIIPAYPRPNLRQKWKKWLGFGELKKRIPQYNCYGDYLYVADCDPILYDLLKYENPDIKAYWLDDGTGSYCRPHCNLSLKRRVLYTALRYYYLRRIDGAYLFAPQMDILERDYPRLPLNNPSRDPEILETAEQVWGSTVNRKIEQAVIYFDQPRNAKKQENDCYDPKLEQRENELLTAIIKAFGSERVGYKLHPRTDAASVSHEVCLLPRDLFWEQYCSRADLSDKVLISVDSSALMTPKMIFDKEPYVIALYRLFENPTVNRAEIDALFGKLQTLSEPGRVLIPDSIEKLENILTGLSEKICQNG